MVWTQVESYLPSPPTQTLLELFGSDAALWQPYPNRPGQIRPVVVDTNVLLNDIAHWVRRGVGTALIGAACVGTFRLFAAAHVYNEVEEHLDDYCRRRRIDAGRARDAWETTYLPLVRFVDVPEDLDDERVARVRADDPDDAPTAALAVLLAPCMSLSQDADLTKHGAAQGAGSGWIELALKGRGVARGDQAIIGSSLLIGLGMSAATRGVRALARSAWGPLATLAVGVAVLHLLERGEFSRARLARLAGRLDPAGQRLADGVTRYYAGQAALSAAAILPSEPSDLRSYFAHLLAISPRPRSGTSLSNELRAVGWTVPPAEVNQLLRSCPAFAELRRAAWQVGQLRHP